MKKFLSIILLLYGTIPLSAQVVIEDGALFTTTGAAIVTLDNMDLDNNGELTQGPGGRFIFSGSGTNTIQNSGSLSQPLFDTLIIAKTGTGKLVLQETVNIRSAVKFNSGIIDLSGRQIRLQPGAVLLGESASSYITDTAQTGYVETVVNLNAPSSVNPGNLGAVITSAQNMLSTIVRRGHKAQVTGVNSRSIYRWYDIIPDNNTALNATLRVLYLDGELNNITESNLELWKSNNNINWTNAGYTTKDAAANYVEQTGIADFSRWTLSDASTPLPLLLTSFQATCGDSGIELEWVTESEKNVSHFEIQRSNDAANWQAIGNIAFKEQVHAYHYTDAADRGFYRLKIADLDGSNVYSSVVHAACNAAATEVLLWPNPVADQVNIALTTTTPSEMSVRVYDSKGAVVLQQQDRLLGGSNTIALTLDRLAAGVYWLLLDWNNGSNRKSVKIIKQ